ncbi:MAG: uracil-DNA glycosylase [Sphingomonadaceae bacterium]|nr:uracil-DNA glycosylase [Sphingomonadaceae bacterium]
MTDDDRLRLHPSWKGALRDIFVAPQMQNLRQFLKQRLAAGATIYPSPDLWFRALDLTPLDMVRVVILGQDPYHGAGQAHGLAFSVLPGVPVPPSLRNIYRELADDVGFVRPQHGNLEGWARQGVLLLNNVLSVEAGQAASHAGKGWEYLTDAVVALLAAQERPIAFLLWGSHAQRKAAAIRDSRDGGRHLVLKAPHPSPLSAHSGFFGCRHFSKANDFLRANGGTAIDWQLAAEVAVGE